jgi:hypothetical protein
MKKVFLFIASHLDLYFHAKSSFYDFFPPHETNLTSLALLKCLSHHSPRLSTRYIHFECSNLCARWHEEILPKFFSIIMKNVNQNLFFLVALKSYDYKRRNWHFYEHRKNPNSLFFS